MNSRKNNSWVSKSHDVFYLTVCESMSVVAAMSSWLVIPNNKGWSGHEVHGQLSFAIPRFGWI